MTEHLTRLFVAATKATIGYLLIVAFGFGYFAILELFVP